MTTKQQILKQYFGYDSFREGQADIIDSIMSGRDTIGILPTGGGKSICFQIPALMLDGITLVISPLISLMKDQVTGLVQNGIKAAYINTSLTTEQYHKAMFNAFNGMYKIIYVAPERLSSNDLAHLATCQKISLIAIDEAHCVSQWGHDFRPSYRLITDYIASIPYKPYLCAFTATATDYVKNDIIKLLGLNNPYVLITNFDRPNLYYEVRQPKSKFEELLKLMVKFKGKTGIIYCLTRKNVDILYEKLGMYCYSIGKYHAGMEDDERKTSQEDFVNGVTDIMIATNAFGMGIDKSDVSFVIHYNMPQNIESYYQEAGRAGRDGTAAKCILLYSTSDVFTNRYLIERNNYTDIDDDTKQLLIKRAYERLNRMSDYCTTTGCLRKYILNYFDETLQEDCGNCYNCNGDFEKEDVTVIAIQVISCISEFDAHFGKGMISKILLGSLDERTNKDFIRKSVSFGKLSTSSANELTRVMDELFARGYIITVGEKYHVLKITDRVEAIVNGNERIVLRKIAHKVPAHDYVGTNTVITNLNVDSELYKLLVAERTRRAKASKVPPFIVFSNSTLEDMSVKKPTTREAMLDVEGVGYAKLQAYGQYFIKVIKDYISNET